MALQVITNTRPSSRPHKVDLRVRIHEDYAPLKHNIDPAMLSALRLAGKTNINLWIDGHLYPPDPAVNYPPTFRDLPSFIHHLGDGEKGLLGYCKRLAVKDAWRVHVLSCQLQEAHSNLLRVQNGLDEATLSTIRLQKECLKKGKKIEKLHATISHMKNTPNGARERKRSISAIDTLAPQGGAFKRRVIATK